MTFDNIVFVIFLLDVYLRFGNGRHMDKKTLTTTQRISRMISRHTLLTVGEAGGDYQKIFDSEKRLLKFIMDRLHEAAGTASDKPLKS